MSYDYTAWEKRTRVVYTPDFGYARGILESGVDTMACDEVGDDFGRPATTADEHFKLREWAGDVMALFYNAEEGVRRVLVMQGDNELLTAAMVAKALGGWMALAGFLRGVVDAVAAKGVRDEQE